jgi:PAS domain S-box-containing protein
MRNHKLAICVADPISRRLLEGVAAQLELTPENLEERQLEDPHALEGVEVIVADEVIAYRFVASHGGMRYRSGGIRPALVAVIPPDSAESAPVPKLTSEEPFDGIIALPQPPAVTLAQLSVILYAFRASALRYESAMEELALNRRIFQSVTSGISVADAQAPDFPLVYVNPAFEVITGYSLEEVVGRNCRFLQAGESGQPALEEIRDALKQNRETAVIIRNYRKDGTAFWNELALSPIRDGAGVVTHFVGIQNDVSARIAFEDALRESEKLAAVGRLAASIAHEINNPLTSVTNLLYLARGEKNEDTKDEYLETAEQELYRVSQLTSQSLRFYKQSTRPQPMTATELIKAVIDVYQPKIAKLGISIQRRDREARPFTCLESEIRQVLSNLVRNAMDAMWETAGTIRVRSREGTDLRSGQRGVFITVADTGIGMSRHTLSQLYTAFFTTKGLGGTGLGLWVSSSIVQRHHGRLSVRSRQGNKSGSVFRLFLPYDGVAPNNATQETVQTTA